MIEYGSIIYPQNMVVRGDDVSIISANEVMEMVKPVVENEDIEIVTQRLLTTNEEGLPVVTQDSKLVGIITTHSILQNVFASEKLIKNFIIHNLPTVHVHTPIKEIVWAEHKILPVTDKNNNYLGLIKKKTEDNNKFILDSRLDIIFSSNQSGILIINHRGIIVSFNSAAERISKFQREKVLGKHLAEVNLPVGLLDVLKTGTSEISKRQQYNQTTFLTNRSPIIENGRIVGAIGIFQDISKIESITEKLKLSKEAFNHLQAILESSYDGFLITDRDGTVLQNNKAFERLTGLPTELIVGRKIEEWVKNGVLKQDVSKLVILRGGPVTAMETSPKGDKLMITGNPVYMKNGEIIQIVINVRDISELLELRKELIGTKELVERFSGKDNNSKDSDIIMNSQKMKDLLDLSWRIAQVDSTILIKGESGVGKELFAKYIFEKSKRYKGPFIRINCGAIPEQLLESELYGYESGAFTGAKKGGKPGMFELADKGTIFLDEIGELPIGLQVKLLRVLQEQEFVRVGGLEPIKVDVRIIAATNRNLNSLIAEGKFREDLYFRLNVIPLEVPSLRERKEDCIPLLHYFLKKFSEKYSISKTLSPETINLLVEYDWPGNVRELSNMIERLIVTTPEEMVKPYHLPKNILDLAYNEDKIFGSKIKNLKDAVVGFEKSLINKAINKHGSTHRAAAILGINPSTLFRKLRA